LPLSLLFSEVVTLEIGGPREFLDKTARLIPNCTYKLYRGKNHLETIYNKQFPKDVLQFVQR
jgi:hypothetical protein